MKKEKQIVITTNEYRIEIFNIINKDTGAEWYEDNFGNKFRTVDEVELFHKREQKLRIIQEKREQKLKELGI